MREEKERNSVDSLMERHTRARVKKLFIEGKKELEKCVFSCVQWKNSFSFKKKIVRKDKLILLFY